MATYTQLSPTALPGKRYLFLPKIGGKGTGLFTALSVIALPGMRHVFLPKESITIGKSKGRKYQVLYETTDLEMALGDDRDFMEIITMIIEAELL